MSIQLTDGYQVFCKDDNGRTRPISRIFGSFREAVGERLRLSAMTGLRYELHAVINSNNSK